MDLIVLLILLRALFGKDLPALRDEIEPAGRTCGGVLSCRGPARRRRLTLRWTFVFYQRQLFSIAFVWRRA
jgi:hypothetical protein